MGEGGGTQNAVERNETWNKRVGNQCLERSEEEMRYAEDEGDERGHWTRLRATDCCLGRRDGKSKDVIPGGWVRLAYVVRTGWTGWGQG